LADTGRYNSLEPPAKGIGRNRHAVEGLGMQSRTGNWQKIWKFFTNPMVDVILVIAVVLVSAWVVIETESSHRKSAFPVPNPVGKK